MLLCDADCLLAETFDFQIVNAAVLCTRADSCLLPAAPNSCQCLSLHDPSAHIYVCMYVNMRVTVCGAVRKFAFAFALLHAAFPKYFVFIFNTNKTYTAYYFLYLCSFFKIFFVFFIQFAFCCCTRWCVCPLFIAFIHSFLLFHGHQSRFIAIFCYCCCFRFSFQTLCNIYYLLYLLALDKISVKTQYAAVKRKENKRAISCNNSIKKHFCKYLQKKKNKITVKLFYVFTLLTVSVHLFIIHCYCNVFVSLIY